MPTIPFTKMHGAANDYVVVDAFEAPDLAGIDWGLLAPRLCSRRTGVGADGVIVLQRPEHGLDADARMQIINADGSDGGMCGNGARCAARLMVERGHTAHRHGLALTLALSDRLLAAQVALDSAGAVAEISIDMGRPSFDPRVIPFEPSMLPPPAHRGAADEYTVGAFSGCFVSMGNPHMVCFSGSPPETWALDRDGPLLERHRAFPERMNVHFVSVESRRSVRIRSWERGVGETMACGTGACAAVVAGVRTDRLDRACAVNTRGGRLTVEWREGSGTVVLGGPAERVFEGEWMGSCTEFGGASAGVTV